MQYLTWRTMTGKNESVQISFMVVRHTKFAPDRFCGLIKKQYRHTFVSTLDEMQEIVRKSISGQSIPQVTKHMDGRKPVNWYDWKSYFCTMYKTIPNITTYHHFRFDKKCPSIVFVRILVDSPEHAVTISSIDAIDIHKLPDEVIPKGLGLKHQWYLKRYHLSALHLSLLISHVPTPHNQSQVQLLLLIFPQTLVDPLRNMQG